MSRSLRGAVVAVTGASAGIGWETALAFGREGARVAVAARRADRLTALCEQLRAMGTEALAVATDVGDKAQVDRFVDESVATFGRLDVLVNNAGYGVRGRVEATPAAAYDELMRVNYLGTVYGCQAAIPIMRKQASGVIINVSSIVGHRSLPTGGAYSATKAAQIALTEALRVELRGTGVYACTVHPIGTESEFGDVQARTSGETIMKPVGPQQPASVVARAIVSCAGRPRPEVYPYPLSRALVWLNALSPSTVDWMASRAARKAGRL
jgi:NADP-dependent 3-hydroxy acid dehydrogenase YdfG